jgi:hypothetical protein
MYLNGRQSTDKTAEKSLAFVVEIRYLFAMAIPLRSARFRGSTAGSWTDTAIRPAGWTADVQLARSSRPMSEEPLEQQLVTQGRRTSELRFVRGRLAAQMLATQGWRRLGFARLGDYTRERFGVAGRTLEEDARVARALERLPGITSAFLASELNWTQVRLLTSIANTLTEQRWLGLAKKLGTSALKVRIAQRTAPGVATDTDEATTRFSVRVSRQGRRMWRAACELAERTAGSALTQAQVLELIVAEAAAGSSHSVAPVAPEQTPSSESFASPAPRAGRTARPSPLNKSAPLLPRFIHAPRDPEVRRFLDELSRREGLGFTGSRRSDTGNELESMDAFHLDAGLQRVTTAMQRIDADFGSLLNRALAQRVHQRAGFRRLGDYVEARLGFCARTAWTLVAVDRAASRTCPALVCAYREGRVSHLAAAVLLPVMSNEHGAAWVERAGIVTLRRLEDEVAWALDRRDAGIPTRSEAPAPPPLDMNLRTGRFGFFTHETPDEQAARTAQTTQAEAATSHDQSSASAAESSSSDDGEEARVQIGAHEQAATEPDRSCFSEDPEKARVQIGASSKSGSPDSAAVELHFLVPLSVAGLAETTLQGLREQSESRGAAFERLVGLVLIEWMSAPAHRDPVFARDGWRCVVPGCRSRRNLHDHHILFRSNGGANGIDNRVTVCAEHHLHGIHAGRIRAHGCAPSAIFWELGCRPAPDVPAARFFGDRYV